VSLDSFFLSLVQPRCTIPWYVSITDRSPWSIRRAARIQSTATTHMGSFMCWKARS
jgi:hypothetical protein